MLLITLPLLKCARRIYSVCIRNQRALLRVYLVRTRDRLSTNVAGWSNRGRNAHRKCGRVVEAGLRANNAYQLHHLTEVILFAHPECVPCLLNRPNNALDIMRRLLEEELTVIPPGKCVKLLLYPLTPLGKQRRLAHRVHSTKTEPKHIRLTTLGKEETKE
ncbi:hypothetical protein BJX65DRAFT_314701 [Aspergillus insuetus]